MDRNALRDLPPTNDVYHAAETLMDIQEKLLIRDLRRILHVLPAWVRWRTYGMLFLMFVLAFFEVLSIFSMSLMAMSIAAPQAILPDEIVQWIFLTMPALKQLCNDLRYFTLVTAFVVVACTVIKNGLSALVGWKSAVLGEDIAFIAGSSIMRHFLYSDYMEHMTGNSSAMFQALSCKSSLGISLARSPFIARMDADDIALPHRLERQCTYLKIHPAAVAVGSYVKLMDECGHTYRTKYLPTGEKLRKAFLWGCPIMHPTVMMRTEAVRKAGGYSPEFPSAEDYALWLRLLSLGEIDNIHEALLSYRVHGSSISHVHARQQRDSTLRAQALWIAGRTFDKDLCHLPTNPLLNALALPPETLRYLLARMLSLNSHIIGVSPKQDPDAQEWLPRILQGPMTPEIRKAMALYHLRAARAPGLSTSARLYQIARCACYSPREFMGKLGEFLRGRLQRR